MSANGKNREKTTILIVDDDKDLRDVYEEVLKRNNYTNNSSVGTGEEAKEKIAEEFFNIAVIDLNLPDLNGMDLISQLRAISPDTEFIIVTGFASIDSAIKSIQFELGGYLEKPISTDKLIRTLDDVRLKQILKFENQKFLKDLEIANKEIRFLNDLLVNNVDELNQSLLLTMVQIERLNPTNEQNKVLQLFQESIRKNARLTRNIRKYQTIEQSPPELEIIDLTTVINAALNRLKEDYSNKNFECLCDLSESRKVIADNNLSHIIMEILLIAILHDPSPKIRIRIDFNKETIDGICYYKITFYSFQANLIYDQRNIQHPSDLQVSVSAMEFQDMGPFIVNEFLKHYSGKVAISELEENKNYLEIFLQCAIE
ncbi:MAG: hybrid sensor histidine kinase/response regulator [Candidatus Heimdallarchaeota archaeon]|nr:hybrid sensor histidine kinase/response regulator [Candidatus Heimdallarchaeota archaeon]